MKCVIKAAAAVITGENPRFSAISATGYNLSVLRRRVRRSVGRVRQAEGVGERESGRASAEISVQMNPAVITG